MATSHPAPLDAHAVASKWVSSFGDALTRTDVDAATSHFHEQGWFRNLLTFGWDTSHHVGRNAVKAYLANTLAAAHIANVKLDTRLGYAPVVARAGPGPDMEFVETFFTFETRKAHGLGVVKLHPPESGEEVAKAFLVVMMVTDWRGHEEVSGLRGVPGGHMLAWSDLVVEKRNEIENFPSVVIVGAGHIGLTIAARLRQIGVNALVIEQHARVGDEWRKRYPSLYLHTPKRHHALLYQPYPSTWPEFTPRDKLAEWLEQYPVSNDLVVWTSSKIETRPSYDKEIGTWDIVVNKNGTPISLNPKHLVWATGTFGAKNIPVVPGLGSFKGPLLHGMDYKGGELFADKKVVVVGSGNTAADICQDLYVQGAKSVTMVQRSKTCLVSNKLFGTMFDMLYPEGTPTEVCDLKYTTTPVPLLREMGKMMVPWANEFDKEMLDGVKKRGFQVWNGHDDSGQLILAFERAGGYSIDQGCAQLIIEGKVKLKQGVEVTRVTTDTVKFTDGTELKADAIIFATGFGSKKEQMRPLFGDDIIDRIDDVWGIDPKDGDVRAGFKPTKQPGLWIPVSEFAFARVFSKQLALYIKAIELGHTTYDEIIKTY